MSRARDLADSADLNFDDGTLVIDSGNNRVGIGKTPGELLDVNGQARATQFMLSSSTSVPAVGAAFYRPAADTIGFVTNSSEKMRIDSSGNLLVGTTTNLTSAQISAGATGFALRGDSDQLVVSRDGGSTTVLNRNTSDGAILEFRKDGSTVGSIGVASSDLYIGEGTVNLRFDGENARIFPATTAGAPSDASLDLGADTIRFKDLYLSGGVYLGGTGAANYLDDYEEGTWTPTSNNAGTIAFSQASRYVKIGRAVLLTTTVRFSDRSTAIGIDLGGAPFANAGDEQIGVAMTRYINNGSPYHSIYFAANQTVIRFYTNVTNSNWNQVIHSDLSNSLSEFKISIWYQTNS